MPKVGKKPLSAERERAETGQVVEMWIGRSFWEEKIHPSQVGTLQPRLGNSIGQGKKGVISRTEGAHRKNPQKGAESGVRLNRKNRRAVTSLPAEEVQRERITSSKKA